VETGIFLAVILYVILGAGCFTPNFSSNCKHRGIWIPLGWFSK